VDPAARAAYTGSMQRSVVLAYIAVLGLGCGAESTAPDQPAERGQAITDGTEDTGHPEVGLLLIGASGGEASSICTATAIGSNVLLTTTHCLDPQQNTLFQLNGKMHQVTKMIRNASWDPSVSKYKHDIGVAFFDNPVSVAAPTYGTVAPQTGMTVTLVGMGRTDENIKDPGTKRKATNTVASVGTGYFVTEGTGGGVGNTCTGDSGGPVYTDSGGSEVVVGVISSSELPCGVKSWHVTVVDYLGWIKDALQPPQVTIDAPADGATVALSALLQVTATDSVGVASVEALVDDASVETLTAAPYDFALTLTSGAHTIKVVARDAVGNSGSAQITVTATAGPLPDGGVTQGDATVAGDGAASGDGAANRPRGEDGCNLGDSGGLPPVMLLLLLGLAALRRRSSVIFPRPPGR
jgi:hypothetical protein